MRKTLSFLLAVFLIVNVFAQDNSSKQDLSKIKFYFTAELPGAEVTKSEPPASIQNLCPTPIYDVTPSKTLNCNAACATLNVRDSGGVGGLSDYMEPASYFQVQTDGNLWSQNKFEVIIDGNLFLRIGPSNTGAGTPTYYWPWSATGQGPVTPGALYKLWIYSHCPTTVVEYKWYDSANNGTFAWVCRDPVSKTTKASGTFIGTSAGQSHIQTNWDGIGTWSCTSCPLGSFSTDCGAGYAQFCPGSAQPGKYGITYTFDTQNGCVKSYTDTIEIVSIYNANWTSPGSLCAGATYNLNNYLSGSATPGGIWSGGAGVPASGTPYTPGTAGTLTLTYTYAGGQACEVSESHTVTINPQPSVTVTPSGPLNYCAGAGVNLTLTASGANSYQWNTAQTTPSIVVSPIVSTGYTVVATSAQGCTNTTSVNVIFNTNPALAIASQTNVGCKGQSTGAATISASSGTPPYTYAWLPSGGSSSAATGLAANIYTVSVTDSQGCTGTNTVTISEPASALTASVSAQTQSNCGLSDGTANISSSGGTAPYTYSWSPGTNTTSAATNLAAGNYSVVVTDNNSCTQLVTLVITNANGPSASTTQSSPNCFGGTGSASVSVTGGGTPYTYSWSTGATGSTISAAAGSYTVVVTDASGCTTSQVVTITQPTAVTASTTATNASCGQNNGSATVVAGGGTAPYTYTWSSGQTTTSVNGLLAGTYTAVISDSKGCTTSASANVGNNAGPTAAVNADVSIVNGTSTTLTASGGTTYSWVPATDLSCTNCANPVASPAQTTTYCVTVSDANNCSDSACVIVYVGEACGEFFLPNAFSPNNDSRNDMFIPRNKCIKELTMKIYNRWGNLVFESSDPNKGWDGISTVNGKECSEGVYVYEIHAKLFDGTVKDQKGTVNLMR